MGQIEQGVHASIGGTIFGDINKPWVVALITTDRVDDLSIIERELKTKPEQLNSGIHGQFYTRPGDAFVYRVSPANFSTDKISISLDALRINSLIWERFTGRKLTDPNNGQMIISTEQPNDDFAEVAKKLGGRALIREGNLEDVAASFYRENSGQYAFWAGMLTNRLLQNLGRDQDPELFMIARDVKQLNNKNAAMPIFSERGIPVPATVAFEGDTEQLISKLDLSLRYIIKSAGGSGGLGLAGTNIGLNIDQVRSLLPGFVPPYQVQEFITGQPAGASALFHSNGEIELISVHQQIVRDGEFQGGYWSPSYEEGRLSLARDIFQRMRGLNLVGPIGLDFIDSDNGAKVIECNPCKTGTQIMPFVRRLEDDMRRTLKRNQVIGSMRNAGKVPTPLELITSGRILEVVEKAYAEEDVIILPQGLDTFNTKSIKMIVVDPNERSEQELLEIQKRYIA